MTTYSKKYFNEETQKWEPLYSTEGRSAYETAKLAGYTGSEEEFNTVLSRIPVIISSIENTPTEGSDNLITSGGVYSAIKKVEQSSEESNQELLNKISEVNTNLTSEINTVNTNLTNEISQIRTVNIPNAIKESIIDNLDSTATDKALSANQGNILKTMIGNLANLRIEVVTELPSTGEVNVIYLVKKAGTNPDVHDEYIYVENTWEKIGNTEVDLSNYYTKEQVYSKSEVYTKTEVNNIKNDIESNIPEGVVVDSALSATSENPVQNKVITNTLSSYVKTADLNVTLGNYYTTNEVYTKEEVNDKIASAGGGDVMASGDLATDYIIVGAGTKSVKNSEQTLSNLALKSEIPSLSGYATQSWVTSQGYSTENT